MGNWDQGTSVDPVADIRRAIEKESRRPYRSDTIIAKVVPWLPKKAGKGKWVHFEIRGATLLLSQRAIDAIRKLPEGVDCYETLMGMVDE